MPDIKLTDKEIVKGLECCIGDTDGKDCFGCPLYEIDDCQAHLNLAALDLINRQKAEIFKEKNKNSKLRNERNHLKTEIERLTSERDAMHQDVIVAEEYAWQCKTAKIEAIKEFAERVKLEFYYQFDELIPSIMADKIDNLVKEMESDNNA